MAKVTITIDDVDNHGNLKINLTSDRSKLDNGQMATPAEQVGGQIFKQITGAAGQPKRIGMEFQSALTH